MLESENQVFKKEGKHSNFKSALPVSEPLSRTHAPPPPPPLPLPALPPPPSPCCAASLTGLATADLMLSCATKVGVRRAQELRDGILAQSLKPIEAVVQHEEVIARGMSSSVDMLLASNYVESGATRVQVEWLHALRRGALSLDCGCWLLAHFKHTDSLQPSLARVHALLRVEGNVYVHLKFFAEALNVAPHGGLWALESDLSDSPDNLETCCPLSELVLTCLHANYVGNSEKDWVAFREGRCVFNMRAEAPVGSM